MYMAENRHLGLIPVWMDVYGWKSVFGPTSGLGRRIWLKIGIWTYFRFGWTYLAENRYLDLLPVWVDVYGWNSVFGPLRVADGCIWLKIGIWTYFRFGWKYLAENWYLGLLPVWVIVYVWKSVLGLTSGWANDKSQNFGFSVLLPIWMDIYGWIWNSFWIGKWYMNQSQLST